MTSKKTQFREFALNHLKNNPGMEFTPMDILKAFFRETDIMYASSSCYIILKELTANYFEITVSKHFPEAGSKGKSGISTFYIWNNHNITSYQKERKEIIDTTELKIIKGDIKELVMKLDALTERVRFIPRDITEPIGTRICERVNSEIGEIWKEQTKASNKIIDAIKGLHNQNGMLIAMLKTAGYKNKLKKGNDF